MQLGRGQRGQLHQTQTLLPGTSSLHHSMNNIFWGVKTSIRKTKVYFASVSLYHAPLFAFSVYTLSQPVSAAVSPCQTIAKWRLISMRCLASFVLFLQMDVSIRHKLDTALKIRAIWSLSIPKTRTKAFELAAAQSADV